MKILLLGGSGLVGREIVKQFGIEHEVIAPSHAELDVRDVVGVRNLMKDAGYGLVINATGYNDVDGAEAHADEALQVNCDAVASLALSCLGHGVPLIHFSTLYVFGDDDADYPKPSCVYAWTKLMGEIAVRNIHGRSWIFRTVRLFGDAGSGKKTFVDIAKDLPDDAKLIVDEYAQPTYVKDLVSEVKRIHAAGKPFATYNIVNAGSVSWMEFAKKTRELIGKPQSFTPVSSNEFHRSAKRPKRLDFPTALRSWEDALTEYLL